MILTNHRKPKCKNIQTKRKFSFMVSWSLWLQSIYSLHICCTHIHSSLSRKHKNVFYDCSLLPNNQKYSVCKNKFQASAHIRQRHLCSNKCQIMGENVTYARSIEYVFTKTYSIKLIQRLQVDMIVHSRIPIHHHQQSFTTTYLSTYMYCVVTQ